MHSGLIFTNKVWPTKIELLIHASADVVNDDTKDGNIRNLELPFYNSKILTFFRHLNFGAFYHIIDNINCCFKFQILAGVN